MPLKKIYLFLAALDLRATTTEARAPRAHAPQQEKPAHHNKE